jgi:hypothetical protein
VEEQLAQKSTQLNSLIERITESTAVRAEEHAQPRGFGTPLPIEWRHEKPRRSLLPLQDLPPSSRSIG